MSVAYNSYFRTVNLFNYGYIKREKRKGINIKNKKIGGINKTGATL